MDSSVPDIEALASELPDESLLDSWLAFAAASEETALPNLEHHIPNETETNLAAACEPQILCPLLSFHAYLLAVLDLLIESLTLSI